LGLAGLDFQAGLVAQRAGLLDGTAGFFDLDSRGRAYLRGFPMSPLGTRPLNTRSP
jgi:hypothetical protein